MVIVKTLFGQVDGNKTYQFTNLSSSARVTALGGKIGAMDEADLSIVFQNPSFLDSTLHNSLSLSYFGYYAGINYSAFAYSRHFNKLGNFFVGAQRIDYGSFTRADETGIIKGTFTASEIAFNIGYSRVIDTCYRLGITVKPIYSHLDNYTSFGIAADIAGSYQSPNGLFASSIVLKNIGTMLKTYNGDTREHIPFEIIAGVSKKLAHAPFRFIVTFQQLQNLNLYYSPKTFTEETVFNETEQNTENKASRISKEFMSHVIVGAEFIPVKNFYFRLGYNYQRRNELKIKEKVSTVGFSWGLGIKISKFHISYSRAMLHLAGSTNHFSVTTDLDHFFKKR